jgi:hypothetical protein
MWFTETPWPPIVILSVLAAILVGVWYPERRGWPLVLVGVLAVLGVGTYFLERVIVTDAERIETSVLEMVEACKRDDVEGTLDFISPQAVRLQAEIAFAMGLADVEEDVHVSDLSVDMVAGRTQAVSHFRANGTINVPSIGHRGPHPSRWELTWQKTGSDWKVIQIRRLNVIDGREMKITERSE